MTPVNVISLLAGIGVGMGISNFLAIRATNGHITRLWIGQKDLWEAIGDQHKVDGALIDAVSSLVESVQRRG